MSLSCRQQQNPSSMKVCFTQWEGRNKFYRPLQFLLASSQSPSRPRGYRPWIFLSSIRRWYRKLLFIKGRCIKHCVTKHNNIQIHISRIDHGQVITQVRDKGSHDHHTFKLPEEKPLRVVRLGIPQILSTDDIKHNLMEMELKERLVARIYKKRNQPLTLVRHSPK